MAYPQNLRSITPGEAVADAMYRMFIGLDRNDAAMVNSAFAGEDILFEMRGVAGSVEPKVFNSRSAFHEQIVAAVGPMDTSHMVSNVRVDVDDNGKTAYLTCYATGQHCAGGQGKDPGAPKFLVAAEFWVDLVKDEDDGLWKVKKWIEDILWTQGDPSIMPKLP